MMRKLLSFLLVLSCITLGDPLLASHMASNHDDDNVAAPAVAAASRAPVLNPDDAFSRLPTHVVRQVGDILLENDPKSLGRFLKVSRTTNTLKDQIFHTTQTMGTKTIDGKERTVMHYAGANNTKDRVLELLGRQTGNPDLFKKDHVSDYQDWSKTDLLRLLALDPSTRAGQAYFQLDGYLKDSSVEVLDFSPGPRFLCPLLKTATQMRNLNLPRNSLAQLPGLSALTNLQWLDINQNEFTKLPGLEALTNLRVLDLCYNQFTELHGLDALTNIETLGLASNCLTSLPGLAALANLQWLDIHNNPLTALPGLDALTNLQAIILDTTQTSQVGILRPLITLMDRQKASNIPVVLVGEEVMNNHIVEETLRALLMSLSGDGQMPAEQ